MGVALNAALETGQRAINTQTGDRVIVVIQHTGGDQAGLVEVDPGGEGEAMFIHPDQLTLVNTGGDIDAALEQIQEL